MAEENENITPESDAPTPTKKVEETRWYSLRVISGKERKIKERIELEIHRSGVG
jgi:transcriptional antiterminator NusG